jgi:hypothetical protein
VNARREPGGPDPVATFAVTFDTELIWGSFDHTPPERFEKQYPEVRATIAAILRLLEGFEVSATWAVVGHLFLDRCERGTSGLAHPELVRPRQSWRSGDWYADDPCTDLERDPLWYGTDVLDAIQAARVPQEIGCHSFGHALYGDPAFSRAAAESDVRACLRLAETRGLRLQSFVFPRNIEGHHDVLREHGFRAFRGGAPRPDGRVPRLSGRVVRFGEHVLATTPPVSAPTERLPGLWDIPGSMLIMSRSGPRKLISQRRRLQKARAGLAAAIAAGGVFHLWTHPFNIASDPRALLGFLEDVIDAAVRARDRGEIVIETMTQAADRAAARKAREVADLPTRHGP